MMSPTAKYLAVKQKLRPAGSDKLQQQHKQQYEAIVNANASVNSNNANKLGSYSFSSGARRNSNSNNSGGSSTRRGRSSQRTSSSSWRRSMLNAIYSLVCTVLSHFMLLAIAFAIGFYLPTLNFLQGKDLLGSKETLLVQASSAILLSLLFTQAQNTATKMSSGNNGTSYRSLDPSDPTAEYINVRERLRKSSIALKQQENKSPTSGSGATKEKTSITMRIFFFLYSCLSFMSFVATCAAAGFYCWHDNDDDMIRTLAMACVLTLWFQQRLALIWQTAFGIGYYYYYFYDFNNHHHRKLLLSSDHLYQPYLMVLMTVLSILLLTVAAELVCGQKFRHHHQDSCSKSSMSTVKTRTTTFSNPSIWTRFTTRPTAATSPAAAAPSASYYDDNPNDPYAQVRQQLRKSPTNNANNKKISPITAMQASHAALVIEPVYTDMRQKLHHVNVPYDELDESHITSPVVKAHAAPAKAKEASRDLGLEKTMELLMQQKSRLDAVTTCITTTTPLILDEQDPAAITTQSSSRGILKANPIAVKGKEGSRDLKLEETMRTCLQQKDQLKKLEQEQQQLEQQNYQEQSSSTASSEIIKTSPVAPKGLEGSRDLKLEETMRICLQQKSLLKKHGVPK